MAQMVEALCYKPEGRGFDSRWGNWDFSFNYLSRCIVGHTHSLTEMSTSYISGGVVGGGESAGGQG